jgi:hypothetical protein
MADISINLGDILIAAMGFMGAIVVALIGRRERSLLQRIEQLHGEIQSRDQTIQSRDQTINNLKNEYQSASCQLHGYYLMSEQLFDALAQTSGNSAKTLKQRYRKQTKATSGYPVSWSTSTIDKKLADLNIPIGSGNC